MLKDTHSTTELQEGDARHFDGAADEWTVAQAARPVFMFPIAAGSKAPALSGDWRDHASADPAQHDAWIAEGYGLAIDTEASGLTVVDLDGGAIGEATWAKLQETYGAAPDTYTVRTPRGGLHLYFLGQAPSTVQKLGPKVDTRGLGGYVVCEGSTADGSYEVTDDRPIAPLPQWVPTALASIGARATAGRGIEPDLPHNVTAATTYLKGRKPIVQGEGADAKTYEIACHLRDLGISADRSIELLRDHLDISPRDERFEAFLERKVANAWAYAQNGEGAWAVASASELFTGALAPVPAGADGSEPAALAPLTFEGLASLLASPPAPVAEVVGGLIEKHVFTTLAGPGGSHKSRLGLQLGLCVSAGIPALGRTVERCAFVFLSYEDPREEIVRRVHALAARLKLPSEPDPQTGFHYLNRAGQPEPLLIVREDVDPEVTDFGRQVIVALRGIPGHKLLLIDGTYNAVRFVGKAKINEDCVMTAIGWFDALCTAADCTIVSLWHPSQAGQERGDASGWSVAWHNRPRARLSIGAVKGHDDTFELRVEKRNHGPKGQPITLHWSAGALLPRGETDMVEAKDKFMQACIDCATMAAAQGAPLTQQKTPPKWVLDEIERACAYRPTSPRIKEALAQALRDERLRYMKGNHSRAAGYYPFDLDRAGELAVEAKRRQAEARKSVGLEQEASR